MNDDVVAREPTGVGTYRVLTRGEYDQLCRRIRAEPDILDRLLMYVAQLDVQLKAPEGIHARNNDQWIFPLYVDFLDLMSDYGEQDASKITSMAVASLMEDVRSGAFFSKG